MTRSFHFRFIDSRQRVAWGLTSFGLMLFTQSSGQTAAPGQAPEGPPPQPLPHPELPAVPLPPSVTPLWIWLALGVVLAALLGVVLLLLFTRPKAGQKTATKHPRREALAALSRLREEAPSLSPPTVAARVSMILRTYLEDRYQIPASRRTTPELFAGDGPPPPSALVGSQLFVPKPLVKSSSKPLEPFAPLAEFWDRLAFAPTPATHDDALQLIETAHTRVQEDPA